MDLDSQIGIPSTPRLHFMFDSTVEVIWHEASAVFAFVLDNVDVLDSRDTLRILPIVFRCDQLPAT